MSLIYAQLKCCPDLQVKITKAFVMTNILAPNSELMHTALHLTIPMQRGRREGAEDIMENASNIT